MDTFVVTEIKSKNHFVPPVIGSFQNGKLKDGEERGLEAGIFANGGGPRVAAVASKTLLYTGTVQTNSAHDDYLVLRNKVTGEATLIPVDYAVLSAQIKRKSDSSDESNAPPDSKKPTLSDLSKQFGSKRSKRITEQKERLRMNIENATTDLEKTVSYLDFDESEFQFPQENENDSLYRPKINRDAANLDQVYVLDGLVPKNVLKALEDEAKHVLEDDRNEIKLHSFIKQHVAELRKYPNKKTLEKCKVLMYVNYLITFVVQAARNITIRYKLCKVKEANDHILNNFTVLSGNKRMRPLSMKDKTVCFIMVLSMLCVGYTLNVADLSKDIKIGIKKLQEMGRILAFSSESRKNKSLMVLKLPLPPPVSTSHKKEKRK